MRFSRCAQLDFCLAVVMPSRSGQQVRLEKQSFASTANTAWFVNKQPTAHTANAPWGIEKESVAHTAKATWFVNKQPATGTGKAPQRLDNNHLPALRRPHGLSTKKLAVRWRVVVWVGVGVGSSSCAVSGHFGPTYTPYNWQGPYLGLPPPPPPRGATRRWAAGNPPRNKHRMV